MRGVPEEAVGVGLPPDTRCISFFLVNRRSPQPDEIRDTAFAFQAQLEIHSERPLVPRPNLRSLDSIEWEERVADLQYRDAFEFAVGHSVATEAVLEDGACRLVRTCWIPQAEVERVAPTPIRGVELGMDELGRLADGSEAQAKLSTFVSQYRDWMKRQWSVVSGQLSVVFGQWSVVSCQWGRTNGRAARRRGDEKRLESC